jgi:predicted transcriptional regulator
MASREEYGKTLDKLAKLLRRKPHTAKQIAAAMGCGKPIAYARIRDLMERGELVETEKIRASKSGPRAQAYFIQP